MANSYNLTHYITMVIGLPFLMQNNHVVPSIELILCLYLANSNNVTHYNIVVIRQNNHVVLSIELLCLYLWSTVTI